MSFYRLTIVSTLVKLFLPLLFSSIWRKEKHKILVVAVLLLISFFILFAFVGRRYFPNQTRGIYFWNNYRSFSLVGRRGGRFQPVGIYFRLTPYFYSSYSALHHRYLLLLVPRSLLLLLITVALIASSLPANKQTKTKFNSFR